MSTEITGDPYTSVRYTIVSKATSDEEDRSALLTTVLEPIFAPKQKEGSLIERKKGKEDRYSWQE